jgi:hypothetical protein
MTQSAEAFALGHFSHVDLPQLSEEERRQRLREARADWPEYCRKTAQKAKDLSERLEKYIEQWLEGRAEARLPKGLLPPYIDSPKTHDWTLLKPEEADPEKQWFIVSPAHQIDPEYKKMHMHGVDSHFTYLKLLFVAPIGTKLLIEGDFPHARFIDYQILQPFDPDHPATGWIGEHPEVPIVDVDIEPDPGHVNPFRVGADRQAGNRHYHLTFELRAGNSVALNPRAMKAPEFRAPGNTRVGGPVGFGGPFCESVFTPSVLWLRIYAPDKEAGPLGGVSIPKAILELPGGKKFWLQPDASLAIERQTTLVPAGAAAPGEPWPFIGPRHGWFKIFGLMYIRSENAAYRQAEPWGKTAPEAPKKAIRSQYFAFWNRGEQSTPPGSYEANATNNNYQSYLTRMFQLGAGKVYVITGRLPSTPKTRNGEPVMTQAQARYWSISQYGSGEGDKYPHAVHYGSLMDDEIVRNEDNEYVIVYSRQGERPSNATAGNGVTWQNWGPSSRQTITIRWLSIVPEWHLPEHAPDERNLPWPRAAWSGTRYEETLVGLNQLGIMRPYHPVIHYMAKEEFEALGNRRLRPKDIPLWTKSSYGTGGRGESEDLQAKLEELRQAFKDLSQARQAGNRQGIAAASRKIKVLWDDLPERARQEIEKKWPGITEKIANMR